MGARGEELRKMGQARASEEHLLVSFSNVALTELRTQHLEATSSQKICTSFSLKHKWGGSRLGLCQESRNPQP